MGMQRTLLPLDLDVLAFDICFNVQPCIKLWMGQECPTIEGVQNITNPVKTINKPISF